MLATTQNETLTESALASLRQDIVTGVFAPMQSLRIALLKERYKMGASPLREALAQLVTQGFVTNETNRGFRVAPMSKEDLEDITLVRQVVETQGLASALEKGGDEWEVGIIAALHRLTLTARHVYDSREKRLLALDEAHWQFHRSLIAGCGSPRLMELQQVYYRQAARYRHVLIDQVVDTDEFVARHDALAKLLLNRQPEGAMQALRHHIGLTPGAIYD
ncbi:MAG TPA: FCD domain-containing protein [Eoetvoesiella sp.]